MKHVIEQWERGDPPNYNTIYRLKSKKFNDDDKTANFKKIYLGKKRSKFSSWLKRVLKKNGWTLRKNTVSQKIPNNWVEIDRAYLARTCELMKVAEASSASICSHLVRRLCTKHY